MLTTINYKIIKKKSQYFDYFNFYLTKIYPSYDDNYRALFINVGHHDISLDNHINPEQIVKIFESLFQKKFTTVKVEIYGLSRTTEYFTHFIEYTLAIDNQLSYRLVYYLNVNDPGIYKYYITLHDSYSDYEAPTIFTSFIKYQDDQIVSFSHVSYNCFELGFAVAESIEKPVVSICKFCYYKHNTGILRCAIHPTLNHSKLTDCNDYKSIKNIE